MDLQELKNTIAFVETADKNIQNWDKLRNKELAIISTESDFFKNFMHYIKTNEIYFDGDSELQPLYISGKKGNSVIDLCIKEQFDFSKEYRDKINLILKSGSIDNNIPIAPQPSQVVKI